MKLKLKKTKPGNLPYICLYHGTKEYAFLVDTGATLNWLLPKTLGDFLQEGETRITKRTVNGENRNVFSATLRVKPRVYTEEDDVADKFQVHFCSDELENVNQLNAAISPDKIHGILGFEFLRTCKIDLTKLVLEA